MASTQEVVQTEESLQPAIRWFEQQGWEPFPFQLNAWQAYEKGMCGLINAPTGFGKTYSLLIPILLEGLRESKPKTGIRAIWVAPIRALTMEIQQTCQRAIEGLGLDWRVAVRSGDTSSSVRKKQMTDPPQVLITTPESIHILLATKKNNRLFKNLNAIIVDEWHELMGSKRGVQIELAISRMRGMQPHLKVWGISATIANIDQGVDILLGPEFDPAKKTIIKSGITKHISVETILPDEIEEYPWAGHLGLALLEKVIPVIHGSKSTIIFTNTRAQCEIWYQRLLEVEPGLAGNMAMHHGSIGRDIREWVEDALHEGAIKVVVSTSSLDLGVDFRPVESVVQIGSPKGVSRFVQRAGRSGHQPLAVSRIYFVPTHTLELIEGGALRTAIARGILEPRIPYLRCFDVLVQYLMTLAVADGFIEKVIYAEVKSTHCFHSISQEEWSWVLDFLVTGGSSLQAYNEYQKVIIDKHIYKVENRRIAQRHRMSIGTIVGATSIHVAFVGGKRLGTIEETFVASMAPGDVFWFAGQALEYVRIKEMTLQVKRSKA
ncbi:MAG: DEAD/DEAH box helicase, partial [Bacteroidota bacterium]